MYTTIFTLEIINRKLWFQNFCSQRKRKIIKEKEKEKEGKKKTKIISMFVLQLVYLCENG